jgi:hypothetical protein
MTTITLTAEQTAIYDGGDDRAERDMMRAVVANARDMLIQTGQPVTIETDDGIVVEFVQ